MKTTRIALLTLVIAISGTAFAKDPAQWPVSYEGKIEPTSPGAVKVNGKDAAFRKPAKDNFRADPGQEGLEFEFKAAGVFTLDVDDIKVDFDKGCTVECRLRLEKTENRIAPVTNNSSAVMVQLSETEGNDPGLWSLGFYTDIEDSKNYVVLEGATTTPPHEIGDKFHVYRVMARGNSIDLYLDGVHIGEVAPRTGVPPTGLRFGNLRGADHTGIAVLDYLKFHPTEALSPIK